MFLFWVSGLGQTVLAHHVFDAPDGLSGPVLILNQAEANVIVAKFTKSDTRRYGNLRFKEDFLGELE